MSLQYKFAVLLSTLALLTCISLGTLWFAFSQWETEVSARILTHTEGQRQLRKINDLIDESKILIEEDDRERQSDQLLWALGKIRDEIGWFAGKPLLVSNQLSSERVEQRLAAVEQPARGWLETGNRELATEAIAELTEFDRFILEARNLLIDRSDFVADYSATVYNRIIIVLLCLLAIVLLTGFLGISLVRRWVLNPVTRLRGATAQIAAGQYGYRIPVTGRDELAKLSNEVNQMAGMISTMQDERVERERLAAVGEMVRRLAHNLRNPLSGIRGLAELSRVEVKRGSEVYEHQTRIMQAVDRFEAWLGDLLNVTSPLKIVPASQDVREWLEGIQKAVEPVAHVKSVVLAMNLADAPRRARFDARHLEHAIVGIITNAIDASPPGEAVRITTTTDPTTSTWDIRISDEGPGIPRELIDKIFRAYFTTKRDGNGIGLAVAQQVITAHAGRIRVESPETGGTTFIVQLPLETESDGKADGGRNGVSVGEHSRSRRRGESQVLNQASAVERRS